MHHVLKMFFVLAQCYVCCGMGRRTISKCITDSL